MMNASSSDRRKRHVSDFLDFLLERGRAGLIMAVGLLVDYTVHVMHYFLHQVCLCESVVSLNISPSWSFALYQ